MIYPSEVVAFTLPNKLLISLHFLRTKGHGSIFNFTSEVIHTVLTRKDHFAVGQWLMERSTCSVVNRKGQALVMAVGKCCGFSTRNGGNCMYFVTIRCFIEMDLTPTVCNRYGYSSNSIGGKLGDISRLFCNKGTV